MAALERPLDGRALLLTRPAERGAALAERLRALGASVTLRPTIELRPPRDAAAAHAAVSAVRSFDWVVFTSANGVEFFDTLFRQIHGATALPLAHVAAIGPATAKAAAAAGHAPGVVATDSTAEGLARALGDSIRGGERVLVVRPEVAREVLPRSLAARGARVEGVAFYRSVPARDVGETARAVLGGAFDALLVTSPSSLECLLAACAVEGQARRAALARTRIVAIGPVTARAVERQGLEPAAVARQATDDAVVECLRRLFE